MKTVINETHYYCDRCKVEIQTSKPIDFYWAKSLFKKFNYFEKMLENYESGFVTIDALRYHLCRKCSNDFKAYITKSMKKYEKGVM